MENEFHKKLKEKIHAFIMFVYDITEKFPKTETYGATSQLRRAAVSIMLNYIEGFARFKPKVKMQFWEMSFGSSKECQYLIFLASKRNWITSAQYQSGFAMVDEICKMFWKVINGLEKKISSTP